MDLRHIPGQADGGNRTNEKSGAAVSGREAIQAAFENAEDVFATDNANDSSGNLRCGPRFSSGHNAGEWSGDSNRAGDPIGPKRLRDLEPLLLELLDETGDAAVESEGQEALNHLLGSKLQLDHGIKRTVGELVESVLSDQPIHEVSDPKKALAREGIHVLTEKELVALRTGKTDQLARLYAETKWRNGAHASALLKLDGVTRPKNPVRVNNRVKQRVILVPFSCLCLTSDEW